MPPSTIRRSFKTRGSSYYFIQAPPGVKVAKEAQSPIFISNANLAGSVAAFLRKTTFACVCVGGGTFTRVKGKKESKSKTEMKIKIKGLPGNYMCEETRVPAAGT